MKVRARFSDFHERNPVRRPRVTEMGKVVSTLRFVWRRSSYSAKYSRFSPEQKPITAYETRMCLSPIKTIGRLTMISRLEMIRSRMRTSSGQSSELVPGSVSSGNIGDFGLIFFVL